MSLQHTGPRIKKVFPPSLMEPLLTRFFPTGLCRRQIFRLALALHICPPSRTHGGGRGGKGGDLNLSPPRLSLLLPPPPQRKPWRGCFVMICTRFFSYSSFSEMDVGSDMLGEGSVTMEEEEEEGIDSLLFLPFDIFSGPHD